LNPEMARRLIRQYLCYRINTDRGNLIYINTPKILKYMGITVDNRHYKRYLYYVSRELQKIFRDFCKITPSKNYYFYIPKKIAKQRLRAL